MAEKIGVFVAWTYANGEMHLGHVAGALLPPDLFARYHRLRGNHVLKISGSDTHGTPITVKALAEGRTPREVYERYHQRFLTGLHALGATYDLYTHTDTENHHRVSRDLFRTLYKRGFLLPQQQEMLFDEVEGRFLADRYVEGTCPHCGYEDARGDQCDNCSRALNATELVAPRSKLSGSTPVVRSSEHFFIDLPAFEARIRSYVEAQEHWRPTVRNFVLSWLDEGLRPTSVTRDLSWGIPVPVEGWEEKVMYVWFEAVIGYLSGSIEWAALRGEPEAWEAWWKNPAARSYYFIGKDNTPFHTVLWGSELMGYDESLNLPFDVPANEFLNLEGSKFSTSRRWAIWLPDFLERYDPDALRYYLTAIAPETRDSDFTWEGFVSRNNRELVAAWGNLVNRVLGFAHKRYDGRVPVPGPLDARDREMEARVAQGFDAVAAHYEAVRLRDALQEAMALAREVNRYLDEKAPWKQFKSDPAAAGTTIFVAMQAIDSLKIMLAPVLPFSSARLHGWLGHEEPLFGEIVVEHVDESAHGHEVLRYQPTAAEQAGTDRWRPGTLAAGTPFQRPEPLFALIDEEIIEQERAALGTDAVEIR